MKLHRTRPIGRLLIVASVVMALVSAGTASASVTAHKKKALSLSTINFGTGFAADSILVWVAQAGGFFKKEGLNVTITNTASFSAAATTASFLGGAYDLLNSSASTAMTAAQQGAGIKAVEQMDIGSNEEIGIASNVAAALHIPTAGSTAKQATAQFDALKGSHLTLAVTNTTSLSYTDLIVNCRLQHLSCNVNDPTADINVQTTGTTTAQLAGYLAGKYQALAAGPPQTIQPNTSIIVQGLIPPVNKSVVDYVLATPAFIHAHADTVQAAVNAIVLAWQYSKLHPISAERMAGGMYAAEAVTSPDEIESLYTDFARFWRTPLMVRGAFANTEHLLDIGSTTPLTLTWQQWADTKFVNNAVRTLHLSVKVPTTVS